MAGVVILARGMYIKVKQSIPKIIHFCWLSDDKYPPLISKCMDSWKENLPDYEFIKWDRSKFDIHSSQFVEDAYNSKKYATAADYIRLYALYHYGGIYLDADVEILKSFDDLLEQEAFIGLERDDGMEAGIMGTVKGNPLFKEFLDCYANKKFSMKGGMPEVLPEVLFGICLGHGIDVERINREGIQSINHLMIYPKTYFSPLAFYNKKETYFSSNTYTIHHYAGSWVPKSIKIKNRLKRCSKKILKTLLGVQVYGYFKRLYYGFLKK